MYFATRKVRIGNEIANYWMYSLSYNSSVFSQLNKTIKSNDYNYIIVESWPENYQSIINSVNYKILFKNDVGILAV